jgi:hypothetical protein
MRGIDERGVRRNSLSQAGINSHAPRSTTFLVLAFVFSSKLAPSGFVSPGVDFSPHRRKLPKPTGDQLCGNTWIGAWLIAVWLYARSVNAFKSQSPLRPR